MAHCYQLFKKGDTEPASRIAIDEHLCRDIFRIEPHKTHWVFGWADTIGWGIAVNGHALGSQELRDYVADMPQATEDLLQILTYLEEHYTSDAWATIGGRR